MDLYCFGTDEFDVFSDRWGSYHRCYAWLSYVMEKPVKKEIVEGAYLTENYFLVFTFGLAASAITILGQAFSWLPGVIQTIESGQATDGMRAVTYLRCMVSILCLFLCWESFGACRIKTN